MLSDTSRSSGKGRSFVLGFHSSAQRMLELSCPEERKKGKCKFYNIECNVRRKLAKEMEQKVRRKAEELYALQSDLTDHCDTQEGSREAKEATVSSTDDRKKRAYVIQELVQELKREHEYKNWSLDAAVVEEMTSQGLRQCPYAHKAHLGGIAKNALQKKTPTTLPRDRSSLSDEEQVGDEKEPENEETTPDDEKDFPPPVSVAHAHHRKNLPGDATSSGEEEEAKRVRRPLVERDSSSPSLPLSYHFSTPQRCPAYWKVWDERRRQLFSCLSPIQKVIVCLLWQQCCAVPLRVVCEDVRELLCQSAQQQIEAFYTRERSIRRNASLSGKDEQKSTTTQKKKKISQVEGSGDTPHIVLASRPPTSESVEEEVEEALSRYLESECMEQHVALASASSFFVLHSTSQPLPVGWLNLSFLPSLVCYASGTARLQHSPSTLLRSSPSLSSFASLFPWDAPPPGGADLPHRAAKHPTPSYDAPSQRKPDDTTHHRSRTPMNSLTPKRDGRSSSVWQASYSSHLPLLLPITRYYFEGLPPSFSFSPSPSSDACLFQEEEEERQLCETPLRSALAKYAPLLPTTVTEKEVHLNTASQAEMILQGIDFLRFVYREEYRCRPPGQGSPWANGAKGSETWRREVSGVDEAMTPAQSLYTHLRYGLPITEEMFHASLSSLLDASSQHRRTSAPPHEAATTAASSHVVDVSMSTRHRTKKTPEETKCQEKEEEEEEEKKAVAGLPSTTTSFQTPTVCVSTPFTQEYYPVSCPSPPSSASSFAIRAMHFQHCGMTSADALLSAIVHRQSDISSELMSLDLSHNRLQSLRFLYLIRHHQEGESLVSTEKRSGGLPQLIRLALHHNAITQKPEYAEQVRCCLPRLMMLDGKKIRRAPLLLPYPVSSSCTTFVAAPVPVDVSVPSLSSTRDVQKSMTPKTMQDTAPPVPSPQGFASPLSAEEAAMVLDYVERFLWMWETKRIPLTEEEERLEKRPRRRQKETSSSPSPTWSLPSKEEWMDEENFPCRYLHPECLFSFAMSSEMKLFDPSVLRLEREVEMEQMDAEEKLRKRQLRRATSNETKKKKRVKKDTETSAEGNEWSDREEEEKGVLDVPPNASSSSSTSGGAAKHTTSRVIPISAQDYREGQLFAVSMKNSSRNLLRGRHALEQIARGSSHCYLAYRSTVYPDGVMVKHHFHSAITSFMKVGAANPQEPLSSSISSPFSSPRTKRPTSAEESVHYIVQLHGILTWELPSMVPQLSSLPPEKGLTAAYDRTMILVRRKLPFHGALFERRKGHALVLKADMLQLRPIPSSSPLSSSSSSSMGTRSIHERRTPPPPPLAPCMGPVQQLSFSRLLPFVLAWGLEGEDRFRVVAVVSEQCGSDAALHATLDILTFRLTHAPPPPPSSSSTVITPRHLAEEDTFLSCSIQNASPASSFTQVTRLPLLYWREDSAEEERRREEEEYEWVRETDKAKKARHIREAAVAEEVRQLLAKEADALSSTAAGSLPLHHQHSEAPLSSAYLPSAFSSCSSPFVLRIVCASPPSGERQGFGLFASPTCFHSTCSTTMQGIEKSSGMHHAHGLASSSPICQSNCPTDGAIWISLSLVHAITRIVNQHYVV